jgi:hypothetical protein
MTGKRLLILLGAAAIVLAGAGLLMFALLFPRAGQFSALPPLTPTPTIVPTARADEIHAVEGVIQALRGQSLSLALPGGQTITITVSASTDYLNGSNPAAFSALHVGQTVIVRGRADPRNAAALLALSILISPAPVGT